MSVCVFSPLCTQALWFAYTHCTLVHPTLRCMCGDAKVSTESTADHCNGNVAVEQKRQKKDKKNKKQTLPNTAAFHYFLRNSCCFSFYSGVCVHRRGISCFSTPFWQTGNERATCFPTARFLLKMWNGSIAPHLGTLSQECVWFFWMWSWTVMGKLAFSGLQHTRKMEEVKPHVFGD